MGPGLLLTPCTSHMVACKQLPTPCAQTTAIVPGVVTTEERMPPISNQIRRPGPHLGGEDLAQLHTPLVKAVDAPHKALHSDAASQIRLLTGFTANIAPLAGTSQLCASKWGLRLL